MRKPITDANQITPDILTDILRENGVLHQGRVWMLDNAMSAFEELGCAELL